MLYTICIFYSKIRCPHDERIPLYYLDEFRLQVVELLSKYCLQWQENHENVIRIYDAWPEVRTRCLLGTSPQRCCSRTESGHRSLGLAVNRLMQQVRARYTFVRNHKRHFISQFVINQKPDRLTGDMARAVNVNPWVIFSLIQLVNGFHSTPTSSPCKIKLFYCCSKFTIENIF